jgi:hypothetical protein
MAGFVAYETDRPWMSWAISGVNEMNEGLYMSVYGHAGRKAATDSNSEVPSLGI